MKDLRIGVDLGGTNIAVALVGPQGEIIARVSNPTLATPEDGQTKIVERIVLTIKELLDNYGSKEEIKGIGIGVPGVCDIEKGVVVWAPNLFWKNVHIRSALENEFNLPTYIDNDANAAALGEAWSGAGKGKSNIVCITIGTGIGAGIVLNGEIFHGMSNGAGELGHVTVVEDGPKCNCGNTGCLEALAAAPAIAKMGKEAANSGVETALAKYKEVSAKEVFTEAKNGDKVANEIVSSVANNIGLALANVINILNPEQIVIGGGVAAAGDTLFVPLKEVVAKRALSALYNDVEIVPAQLGNDAGIIGAAALVK